MGYAMDSHSRVCLKYLLDPRLAYKLRDYEHCKYFGLSCCAILKAVRSDFLIPSGFLDDISESRLALFCRYLRINRKQRATQRNSQGRQSTYILCYERLFRHQSLFALSFCLFTSAIHISDEIRKSEVA